MLLLLLLLAYKSAHAGNHDSRDIIYRKQQDNTPLVHYYTYTLKWEIAKSCLGPFCCSL